jgi:hypothetical protein
VFHLGRAPVFADPPPLRFASTCELEEMMGERGVAVDHTTLDDMPIVDDLVVLAAGMCPPAGQRHQVGG